MRRAIGLLLIIFAIPGEADRCSMTGGCIGQVGYMYLPQSQRGSAAIFEKPGLPNVNAVVVLKENGYVLSADSISDNRLPADLAKAVKDNAPLQWGIELGKGAKVRILGYQAFPLLKPHARELFAFVLILTDDGK